MRYSRFLPAMLLLLLAASAFSAEEPYTIFEVKAEDIEQGNSPKVTIDCYDAAGDKMNDKTDATDVDLYFYTGDGKPISGVPGVTCSGSETATPVFPSPGIYRVDVELACAPGCCKLGGGCTASDHFSVSTPIAMAGIPDSNPVAAVAACLAVLLIARKKVKASEERDKAGNAEQKRH